MQNKAKQQIPDTPQECSKSSVLEIPLESIISPTKPTHIKEQGNGIINL